MTIAIIGGGIAGLATALNLHRAGLSCRVFEAAPSIKEIGVGITLLPHAMRELAALGLESQIRAAGVVNRESAFFNRFGQKIFAEPRGLAAGYPYPEIGIHRGRLHGILYRTARERLGADAVMIDHQFTSLTQDDGGVTLRFAGSSGKAMPASFRADIVLACDGINSSVRKQFYPDEPLAFTGINTWRGITRRRPILDGQTYLRVGSLRTGKIVIYPIVNDIDESGCQLINWIAEIQRDSEKQNDWNKQGSPADILSVYETFRFPWLDIPELIGNAEMILEYPMVDREPIPRWTFGRVTLVGDAAHPMYPRGSNGSAQALIDARAVANALVAGGAPVAALEAYEAERAPVTAAIVRANRTRPPDLINLKVEELIGDRPFSDLDSVISQDELQRLSNEYKEIAGFSLGSAVAR